MKKTIKIVILALILAGAGYGIWRWQGAKTAGAAYRSVKVERGNISQRVNATGSINPLINVTVGTQVSGIIAKMYVDFNSKVKQGALLAELDPTLFDASVKQAEGDYLSAQANVESAQLVLKRTQELFDKKIGPQSDRDDARAKYDAALGALKNSEGELQKAKADLDHTKIYSPVDGIVTSRAVDIGQTVAASLSSPTLFTIAKDLTQMQIDTFVDQADIGQVHEGQAATFMVDAYPGDTFTGAVMQIRNSPTNVQNVITYDVIVSVNNPDLKLRPGMTANVRLLVAESKDALKLANSALRFRPVDWDFNILKTDTNAASPAAGTNGASAPKHGKDKHAADLSSGVVYVLSLGVLERRVIELGFSDGQFSEVKHGLKEGDALVTGYSVLPKDTRSNPFMPFGGRRY